MAILLTFEQQKAIKAIGGLNSANAVAQAKYTQLAEEVESLDIDLLLGSRMYQEVSANPDNYADLLDGSTFEGCDGEDITHKGLRYTIAFLNYAKWVSESYINDTWSGMTQKNRPDSQRISSGDIKRLEAVNREIAFNAFKLTKDYIIQDDTLKEYWTINSNKRTKTPKFDGLKRTLR